MLEKYFIRGAQPWCNTWWGGIWTHNTTLKETMSSMLAIGLHVVLNFQAWTQDAISVKKNIINSSNINIIINITCQDTLYQTLGWDVFQFIPRFWNTSGVASLCSGNFTRPLLEHVFIRPWWNPPKKYGHVHPPILTVPPVFVHFPSSPNIFQPSTSTFKGCHLMKRGLMLYHSILCPACYEGLESWNVWIGVFVDHGIFDVPQLASSKLVPAFRITMLVQMISVTSKNGFIIHKHRYTYK